MCIAVKENDLVALTYHPLYLHVPGGNPYSILGLKDIPLSPKLKAIEYHYGFGYAFACTLLTLTPVVLLGVGNKISPNVEADPVIK